MKREDLRPIEYQTMTNPQKGYFHKWIVKKQEDGSDLAIALFETEDGVIKEMLATSIKFID